MSSNNRRKLQTLRKAWKEHSPSNPFYPSDEVVLYSGDDPKTYSEIALDYEIAKHTKRQKKTLIKK